jgi:hypothetical protein
MAALCYVLLQIAAIIVIYIASFASYARFPGSFTFAECFYHRGGLRRIVAAPCYGVAQVAAIAIDGQPSGWPLHLILRRTRTIGLYLRNGIRIAFGQNPNFITVFEAVERQTPSESHASS